MRRMTVFLCACVFGCVAQTDEIGSSREALGEGNPPHTWGASSEDVPPDPSAYDAAWDYCMFWSVPPNCVLVGAAPGTMSSVPNPAGGVTVSLDSALCIYFCPGDMAEPIQFDDLLPPIQGF